MKIPSYLPPPLGYRKNIPLYYPKTEAEIKADSYERYNPNVLRSCRNFYEGSYGTILLEKLHPYVTNLMKGTIVELGCGSGYLIGNIAAENTELECLGLDYSYQMLKIAAQVFKNQSLEGNTLLTAFQNGMKDLELENKNLANLTYALSDACVTPLADESIDFCFSCFLFDRVVDPLKLIKEKIRITKSGSKIVFISPFNYLTQSGWEMWHPVDVIIEKGKALNLEFNDKEHFQLSEMLDIRGNRVVWEVDMLVFQKS